MFLGHCIPLAAESGLFLIIVQQPLPGGREKGPFLDENPDFGLKALQMRERKGKQNQGEKGSFLGETQKTDSQHPFSELNFQT